MAGGLREWTFELLKSQPGKRFRAREIALWIRANYPNETAQKMKVSKFIDSETALINQIVAEIGSNRPAWQVKYGNLRTTEGRPRTYYWTDQTESDEVDQAESNTLLEGDTDQTRKVRELDLYPVLVQFADSEFGAKAVRISEATSSNKHGPGGNKWLYPDVVALEALTSGFHQEVIEAVKHSGDRRARLWSFEAKLLLNRSNVREAYFQAVSNSSWANFGYLVANEIEGASTIKEIQMLYSVHGIGLIELDFDSPTESIVRIPARERSNIEWSMCSRLANENRDFREFMRRVRQFYQTGDL